MRDLKFNVRTRKRPIKYYHPEVIEYAKQQIGDNKYIRIMEAMKVIMATFHCSRATAFRKYRDWIPTHKLPHGDLVPVDLFLTTIDLIAAGFYPDK